MATYCKSLPVATPAVVVRFTHIAIPEDPEDDSLVGIFWFS